MMELVERAIPVIQHVPGSANNHELKTKDSAVCSAAEPRSSEASPIDGQQHDDTLRAGLNEALSQVHRTLERLRTQHAQLTSGALLQQYQRHTAFPVEDSRPATKLLSVIR
ncbi:hypothetical protein [Caulifigura coniformis]|nr:hypothetical protein [Caulifigura coniformis]